jgi:hypothetical protein
MITTREIPVFKHGIPSPGIMLQIANSDPRNKLSDLMRYWLNFEDITEGVEKKFVACGDAFFVRKVDITPQGVQDSSSDKLILVLENRFCFEVGTEEDQKRGREDQKWLAEGYFQNTPRSIVHTNAVFRGTPPSSLLMHVYGQAYLEENIGETFQGNRIVQDVFRVAYDQNSEEGKRRIAEGRTMTGYVSKTPGLVDRALGLSHPIMIPRIRV